MSQREVVRVGRVLRGKYTVTSISISSSLLERLDRFAKLRSKTRSRVVTAAIILYLNKERREDRRSIYLSADTGHVSPG